MPRPHGQKTTNVVQGEYAISEDPDEMLTTVLGSCVAVCMFDTGRGIGGMNHFLLPSRPGEAGANVRYGAYAMELLINGLLKRGAARDRLQAKMFGGASMIGNVRDIGAQNAAFARRFLADERIPCRAESLGGVCARRIRFWPVSGLARQMLVEGPVDRVAPPRPAAKPAPAFPAIELF
ncbi:chemotaxis protein CheD [Pseudoponticoccus marisrubri]|uniref:Probable chemoreceptor glutamine deamidase CheD n=1 Tax=Pseudoponticoccus marisrubri TaxID=1685382 RepID=A0A0W7WQK4_9RHOB|nr:chemotaxis protein CheD [Pseudoponticoccus marisrubri]KUF12822.1 chemotaxis protein CheD [Pseudoponticoccus marisrubri]